MYHFIRFIAAMLVMSASFNIAVAQQHAIAGEFIVMLNHDRDLPLLRAHLAKSSKHIQIDKLGDMPVYKITQHLKSPIINQLIFGQIRTLPYVKIAQKNHRVQTRETVPNDPLYPNQWQYKNTGQDNGTPGADLDAELAWDITTGGITPSGDTIVIAVIDNAFDVDHEDLTDNLWRNEAEVPNNGIDDDNNGYVDDYFGWNPLTQNGNLSGSNGHGTSVAGIIGAKGNNNIGVSGVNWHVKIMLLTYGSGNEDQVVQSLLYILKARKKYNETNGAEGAFVVATNSSFGLDQTFPSEAPIWCAMFDSLGTAGILSAGATTNSNSNVDLVGDIPTACPSPYLIAVTNVDGNDEKVTNAGYGTEHIDIGAFGARTYTTNGFSGGNYRYFGGTSGATPHVAGAVGLLYAAPNNLLADLSQSNPALAALLVKEVLIEGSEDNASLSNNTAHGKRLNLHGVLLDYLSRTEACLVPNQLQARINDVNGDLEFSWLSGVDSSYFYYQINGQGFDSLLVDTHATLSGLASCVTVDWFVKAKCNTTLSKASEQLQLNSAGCCIAPSNLTVDSITATQVYISYDKAFGFNELKVLYKPSSSSTFTDSLLTTGSGLWINNLDSCTTYDLAVKTVCQQDTSSLLSTIRNFRTLGCSRCYDTYCQSLSGTNEYEFMSFIRIGNWTASTGAGTGYDFYADQFGELKLEAGKKHPVEFEISTSFPNSDEYVSIYIDINHDQIFTANERCYNDVVSTGVLIKDSLLIPMEALLGPTRMRVQLSWNEDPDGCGNINFGEVEDYCMSISSSTIGVSELTHLQQWTIFPNPVSDVLHVEGMNEPFAYTITDISGQFIRASTSNSTIDVAFLPPGIYLLQIDNFVHRFVKQ